MEPKPQRNPDIPLTYGELKIIDSCINWEESLELMEMNGELYRNAILKQLPSLFHAWKAKSRAEAELFHEQVGLQELIKTKEKQLPNVSR